MADRFLLPACRLAIGNQSLKTAENYLKANGVLTFGIQSISLADRSMEYINLGDTYEQTIYCENGMYSVGSWGNWYEEAEKEHCQDNNMVSCGNCGEFTEKDCKDWREVVCSSCGRNVSTGELPKKVEHA